MRIEIKKTNELAIEEKENICLLFKNVFNITKTYKDFIHQFEKNEFGYSYFGLVYDNNMIIGSYAVIPLKYNYYGEEMLFGQSVDTMIDENYRGNPFLLKKLAEKVYKKLKEDSISFVFGFPNDRIYLVRKKTLKWNDIYNLDIYLLPVNIGAVKKTLTVFGPLVKIIVKFLNIFVKKDLNLAEDFKIYKNNSLKFTEYRFTDKYIKIFLSNSAYCFYNIKKFNNINTAFIVDIFPLTKHNLEFAVKQIYKLENNIDLIAYFGFLPFSPINLFKVPKRFKPKNTFMSGRILDTDKINESIFDIKKWRVNLSSFDWI